MKEFGLNNDILIDSYISSCIKSKYKDKKVDNKLHLIKVTYKSKIKHQVWDKYDGITESEGEDDKVYYEYLQNSFHILIGLK